MGWLLKNESSLHKDIRRVFQIVETTQAGRGNRQWILFEGQWWYLWGLFSLRAQRITREKQKTLQAEVHPHPQHQSSSQCEYSVSTPFPSSSVFLSPHSQNPQWNALYILGKSMCISQDRLGYTVETNNFKYLWLLKPKAYFLFTLYVHHKKV